jgi:hypothetical protein
VYGIDHQWQANVLPHLGFQCSVKTFNDTGFGLLVVSGKEVHVVFLEKLLKYSVDTSVEHGYWEQKGLTSTLTDQGPYEFAVSGVGDDYIDVTEKGFYVRPVGIHAGRWRNKCFV